MPRPHKHPSLTCYKRHKCRCEDCTRINTLARERERDRRREWRPPPPRPLDEATLTRLRRAVGLE